MYQNVNFLSNFWFSKLQILVLGEIFSVLLTKFQKKSQFFAKISIFYVKMLKKSIFCLIFGFPRSKCVLILVLGGNIFSSSDKISKKGNFLVKISIFYVSVKVKMLKKSICCLIFGFPSSKYWF